MVPAVLKEYMVTANLRFVEEPKPSNRKTNSWLIYNKKDVVLGRISFYGAWRSYVFSPVAMSMFDVRCLYDIQEFINDKHDNWQESVKKGKKKNGNKK